MGSMVRLAVLLGTAFAGTAALAAEGGASADALPLFATVPLPASVAATPPLAAADPRTPDALYHGLYVGTEIFGIGGKGIKGGFGGDIYAGYERQLDSGVIVGLQGTTGYGPALFGRPGLKGFDFGEASAHLAYPLGRFTPFVDAGLVVAKPVTGPGIASNTTDSFNDLMNGAGTLYAAPRVGAGVAYQLTTNTSVAFGVSVSRGIGGIGAFP